MPGQMTAREFLDWQQFVLERDKQQHENEWTVHRTDYYHAQIVYWIYLLQWTVANLFERFPKRPEHKIEDFILKFNLETGENEEPEYIKKKTKMDEEELQRMRQERMEVSKAAWGAFILGTTKDSPKQIEGRSSDEP